jgi:hypothetical protein
MGSDHQPVVFDDDNPEWTKADFARARPIADFPELAAAFPNGGKPGVGRKAPLRPTNRSFRCGSTITFLSGSARRGRAGRAG